jgi:hypothetical protein
VSIELLHCSAGAEIQLMLFGNALKSNCSIEFSVSCYIYFNVICNLKVKFQHFLMASIQHIKITSS